MAGSITISSITLDSDNNFSIKSNTGSTIMSANGTGLITGIAPGTIIASQIASNTITGDKITVGSLAGNVFTANTITGDKIGQAAISSNNIVSVNASVATIGTLPTGRLPSGTVLQVVRNAPSSATVITQSSGSFAEVSTEYRTSITPIRSDSILLLEWTGLCGSNFNGNISSIKFYDITNGADVGLSGLSLGSRSICHASYRHVEGDGNDRDMITMKTYITSSSTTARTYGIYAFSENGVLKYWNATATDNSGCSYARWQFTITEIAA